MRKTLLTTTALALLALAAPGAAFAQQTEPGNAAAAGGQQQLTAADRQFVNDAAVGNMFEIESSRLALERSDDAGIERYGQQMIDEHTRAGELFTAILQPLGVTPPTELDAKHRALLERVRGASGDAFGAAYLDAQIQSHQETIDLFQRQARDGDNDEIKQFAQGSLAAFQQHLQMARDLRSQGGAAATASAAAPVTGGQAPATGGPAEAGTIQFQQSAAQIAVQQPAPQVQVSQPAPQVEVSQSQPRITVRQPAPQITINQPQPVVTVEIPQPTVTVNMPEPIITVEQAQPEVRVSQAQPEVRVEQAQPVVRVEEAQAQPTVNVQPGQPIVQVERAEPEVRFEREGEARVEVRQAEGGPQVNVQQATGEPQVEVRQAEGAAEGAAAGADLRAADANPATVDGGATAGAATAGTAAEAGRPANPGEGATANAAQGTDAVRLSAQDANRMIGADVVTANGQELGEVSNLLVGGDGQVRAVVVAWGGFLGLGEVRAAIPWNEVQLSPERDRVIISMTEDQIRSAPRYDGNQAAIDGFGPGTRALR